MGQGSCQWRVRHGKTGGNQSRGCQRKRVSDRNKGWSRGIEAGSPWDDGGLAKRLMQLQQNKEELGVGGTEEERGIREVV